MNHLLASRNRHVAELAHTLVRLAPTELTLLIEGGTGTGKSFIAARAHRVGRRGRPYVVVDCGAIPPTLLASELFGHRAGAFTDATRPHRGLFERSADGTLVLDRVDALPPEGQTMLLRTLEEHTYFPVGTTTPRRFRARVIALADAGLMGRVGTGSFRLDLYHRLAGFHGKLPALRHRPEDILPYARDVIRRGQGSRRCVALAAEVESLLTAYPWPGNFRELEMVLVRARIQAAGMAIRPADLGLPLDGWPAVAELASERRASLGEVSRLYALWILAHERGNVSRAAAVLGISRRTLIRWRQGI